MCRSLQKITAVVLFVIFVWTGSTAQAQSTEEEYRFEGYTSVGLNTDGAEWTIGAAWFPIPYFGFKVAIGLDSEIRELASWGYDDEYSYGYDYDDYCTRFQFCPSIELRTPSLVYFRSQGFGIQLFASPGMIMSPRAAGSNSGEWLYWNMRGGLMTVLNERCTLQLGYGYSSFNLYAGSPISHWGYDEGHHNTHSVFITLGYKF